MGKYYDITYEDLYPGLEYEYFGWEPDSTENEEDDRKWYKSIFFEYGVDLEDLMFDYKYTKLNINKLRVKYLDQFDIEDLGFELLHSDGDDLIFKIDDDLMFLQFDAEDLNLSIYVGDPGDPYTTDNLFQGRIKNKSELKKLLTQLGIEIKKRRWK